MPENIPLHIQCNDTTIRSYGFTIPGDRKMIALWTDEIAVDYDPGVQATIKIPGFIDEKVYGIDVLHGFGQELITEVENDSLVIRDFLVKDYPIFLRMGSTPLVVKDNIQGSSGNYNLDIYPNPFSTNTIIEFQIPERSDMSIKIFNLLGQVIRDFGKKEFEPGIHSIEWNGTDNKGKNLDSGIYLIRMESENCVRTVKCMFLK